MRPPPPILVAHLFPEVLNRLLELLSDLPERDWRQSTVCTGWSVKDVALHLLGGEIGNLARRRDGHAVVSSAVDSWDELVEAINAWNEEWVEAARRMSTRLLIDLLELTGRQMSSYFQLLDPHALGGAVAWAGPEPAPVWLDLAREYTERWHHQQHIRDAVGRPGLMEARYLAPVLACFAWALPPAFRSTHADEGTAVTLTVTGEAGGRWTVVLREGEWLLTLGAPERPQAEAVMGADVAWRLFTRGLSPGRAAEQVISKGDPALVAKVMDAVAIIA